MTAADADRAARPRRGRWAAGPAGPAGLPVASLVPRYRSPLHDERNAAWLGLALGVAFAACFLTGVWSHLQQDPPSWFDPPARPAGLYRITQGVHVVTGFASIPLLLAKLWVVHPHLVAWPPVGSVLHAVERLALLPLVAGAGFLLLSGVANVARWYPWTFFFPRAHFWAAWITIGGLVVHIGAKAGATTRVLTARPLSAHQPGDRPGASARPVSEPQEPESDLDGGQLAVHHGQDATASAPVDAARPAGSSPPDDPDGPAERSDRRAFLAGVGAASALLAVGTAGGTVAPLSPVSFLAQRRPDDGPQGLPVNKSAASARVEDTALDPGWRLAVEGDVRRPLTLSLDDLRDLPSRSATLPIACVEGWSASATWTGVPVRDLVELAGVDPGRALVTVESLQPSGRYRESEVFGRQLRDPDTLLALALGGEPLHVDHGFPVRLIGPNRPGVLQTKWVARLVVR